MNMTNQLLKTIELGFQARIGELDYWIARHNNGENTSRNIEYLKARKEAFEDAIRDVQEYRTE